MAEIEETVRDALQSSGGTGPSSDAVWADVQRRIRRRKNRHRAMAGLAAGVVLVAGGLAIALAAGADDDSSTVVDVGPGPSTTEEPDTVPTTTGGPVVEAESAWFELAAGPVRDREGVSATWMDDELIAWGGMLESGAFPGDQPMGAVYDPVGDTWHAIADSPLAPRRDHIAVWTGDELLVWGGRVQNGGDGSPYTYALDGGAAYDPASDSWRMLPDAPLPPDDYTGLWTGDELVVIGGGEAAVTGAAYDPASDSWREIAPPPYAIVAPRLAWTGDEVLLVGGIRTGGNHVQTFSVMAWDPATDTWREQGGAPMTSQSVEASWTGDELVVWGHAPSQEGTWILDGPRGNYRSAAGFPAECEDRIQSVTVAGRAFGVFCDTYATFDATAGAWTGLAAPPSAGTGLLVAAGETVYRLGEDGSLAALTP
jgi:hypothetical protein